MLYMSLRCHWNHEIKNQTQEQATVYLPEAEGGSG